MLVSSGSNCLNLFHPNQILFFTAASASPSTLSVTPKYQNLSSNSRYVLTPIYTVVHSVLVTVFMQPLWTNVSRTSRIQTISRRENRSQGSLGDWREYYWFSRTKKVTTMIWSMYRVRPKKHPPLQKSHYFQNNLIFFGENFRGYSWDI